MIVGIVLIISAFSLVMYNINESLNAGIKSRNMVSMITEYIDNSYASISSDYYPEEYYNSKMTGDSNYQYFSEDGLSFAGILNIPELKINLPVCSDFSMKNLSNYPCIYSGNISDENIIIAAHKYDTHFGSIKLLDAGDRVMLRTLSGRNIIYEVFSVDIIPGNKPDEMSAGDWDLTLFTCTRSGTDRIAVRCFRSSAALG